MRKSGAEEIDAIYASLPKLECKGLCHQSCGPVIPMLAEEDSLRSQDIRPPRPRFDLACSKLTPENRCSIYENRPLVCRLFGSMDSEVMRCPYGCKPERWVTEAEANRLFIRLEELAPDSPERKDMALVAMASNRGLDPLHRGMAKWYLRRVREGRWRKGY